MSRVFWSVALSIILFFYSGNVAYAQSAETVQIDSTTQAVLETSFNDLPPFKERGEVPDIGALISDQENTIDYDTSRTWEAGDRPADVVKIGDVETGLGLEELSLSQIGEIAGFDIEDLTVGQLDFLVGTSLEKFVEEIPFLGEWDIEDLPDLLEIPELSGLSGKLGEILKTNVDLGAIDVTEIFGDTPLASIPNVINAQLSDFDDIGSKVISSVPGLGDIDLGNFPIPLSIPNLNFFPRQDLSFEKVEYSGEEATPQPVSGGTNGSKDWQPIACTEGCAHIELADKGWEGANWMTKDHRVKDGFGLLGGLFGEAGAYRLPFGDSFAFQVTDTDEKTGEAEWGIAFRVCKRGFIDLGCTAYFLEVPLGIKTGEGDNIITGMRDGKGGASQPLAAPPGWEKLRPDLPPELQGIVGGIATGTLGGGSLCGDGPGGVKFEALAEAYEEIESKGSGGYGAIGVWVNLSYAETGRAFGRYQYMSYRRDVVKSVSARPGGAALLAKARQRYANITADEMLAVFPPEAQDDLFKEDQAYMIQLALDRGYRGDALLSVLSQMHFRGPGVLDSGSLNSKYVTDSLGTSLYDYGRRFVQHYREKEKKYPDGEDRCKATGDFINPLYDGGTPFTRRYSAVPVTHPVYGTARPHLGDDLGVAQGTKIVASDGGTIEWVDGGGFGWWIIVVHGNGYETIYAHLSDRIAPNGSKVEKGDVIALSGGAEGTPGAGTSNGPHLHFEVRQGIKRLNPASLVDYSVSAKSLGK